jgi:hypothetical protein
MVLIHYSVFFSNLNEFLIIKRRDSSKLVNLSQEVGMIISTFYYNHQLAQEVNKANA